ncbi:MAG: DEAD/DEAH box helicase [Tissierellales bacterium]|jgi:ATP-dependent RNA helicase DeaD|nr:DEAD/DEAH box helicase [Tissierellales bacterium]
MKFNELELSGPLVKATVEMGFEEMTEIQERVIPTLRDGRDCIGQSQTGTGKTAAFSIPILEQLDKGSKKTQAVIICPTRELSVQVCDEIKRLTKYMNGVKVVPVYGGEPIFKQINQLKRGAQIVVGTPGRLIDHIKRKTVRLGDIKTVVLDEADEMLKMGFREDIEFVLDEIDRKVQIMLFSATFPKSIMDIAKHYQEDPEVVKVKAKRITSDTVLQQYSSVKRKDKYDAIQRFLNTLAPKRCIVFCNTKSKVDELTELLQTDGYRVDKIHGDLKQTLRMNVLRRFNEGQLNIMVGTDVAARGLDIQNVDLVFNYDLPDKEDYYVHRIGRSGRAGKAGRAISLVSRRDYHMLRMIEKYTSAKVEKIAIPTINEVNDTILDTFAQKLAKDIAKVDRETYEPLLQKLYDEGYDSETIALALMGRTITLPSEKKHDINDQSKPVKGSNGRNDKRSSGKRGGKKRDRGSKNQDRLFFNLGKNDGIKVGDLVGAIAGETGVSPNHIGSIDLFDKYGFVDVDKEYSKKVLKKLNKKRIKGKKVALEPAN